MNGFNNNKRGKQIRIPMAGKSKINPKKPWCFEAASLNRGKYRPITFPALIGKTVETRKENEKSTRVKPTSSAVRKFGCTQSKLMQPIKIPA